MSNPVKNINSATVPSTITIFFFASCRVLSATPARPTLLRKQLASWGPAEGDAFAEQ